MDKCGKKSFGLKNCWAKKICVKQNFDGVYNQTSLIWESASVVKRFIVYAWLWMIWCHGNSGVLFVWYQYKTLVNTRQGPFRGRGPSVNGVCLTGWTRPPLSHWYSIICKNVMTRRTIPSQEESLKSTWWTTSRLLNKGQTVKEKNLSNNKLRRKKMSLVFKYIPHIWRNKTWVES